MQHFTNLPSVQMRSPATAVNAMTIFMVTEMIVIILIPVGMNHVNIEIVHVTLSPIQLGCLILF